MNGHVDVKTAGTDGQSVQSLSVFGLSVCVVCLSILCMASPTVWMVFTEVNHLTITSDCRCLVICESVRACVSN